MGSDSGKYLIPFGIFVLLLNVVLILILLFQDVLIPKKVTSVGSDTVTSAPTSFTLPVSF